MEYHKELHDRLLKVMPDDFTHDPGACLLCSVTEADLASLNDETTPVGGDMSDKTYSQEELDAAKVEAIAEAVKPLEDKINDFESSQEQAQVDARIAEVREELETQTTELQAQLDSANAEAGAAKQSHEELVQYLEAAEAEKVALAELAERKEERLAIVKEHANFTDEYIEANADRWAAMDQADFDANVEDWKAIDLKKPEGDEENNSTVPTATAMVASRSDADTGNKSGMDAVRDVLNIAVADKRDLASL